MLIKYMHSATTALSLGNGCVHYADHFPTYKNKMSAELLTPFVENNVILCNFRRSKTLIYF